MSELERWFPMSIYRSPRSFFDADFGDEFVSMDRQMRAMQREMDRMAASFHRLTPYRTPALPSTPLDMRLAEDALASNPVVTDKEGNKKMQMNFDVRAFKPEEITVKTKDGKFMEVNAKHEETTEGGKVLRHYHRMFSIPPGVQTQDMTSVLSPEGVLSVTAPIVEPQAALEAPKERPIAITHE